MVKGWRGLSEVLPAVPVFHIQVDEMPETPEDPIKKLDDFADVLRSIEREADRSHFALQGAPGMENVRAALRDYLKASERLRVQVDYCKACIQSGDDNGSA